MLSLQLKNIRSITDSGNIELRPITLFLGQNSSGKSTFLRTFPLLKQSVITRSNSPILWYGDLVDFGSIEEVQSTFSPLDGVSIDISVPPNQCAPFSLPYTSRLYTDISTIRFGVDVSNVDGKTTLRSFRLQLSDDVLFLVVDPFGKITSAHVNGVDYTKDIPVEKLRITQEGLIPSIISVDDGKNAELLLHSPRRAELVRDALIASFKSRLHGRMEKENIARLISQIYYRNEKNFPQLFNNVSSPSRSWKNFVHEISKQSNAQYVERLRSLYFLSACGLILPALERCVYHILSGISYMLGILKIYVQHGPCFAPMRGFLIRV
ncbi:MAG: hypothetical protein KG075_03835 [Alphaproteobacteria bacterium]|nr:hypothetical protein [Alphaproteobacteria bacterium]